MTQRQPLSYQSAERPRAARASEPPAPGQIDLPVGRDWPFVVGLCILTGLYVVLIGAMLLADLFFTSPGDLVRALRNPDIKYSIRLSLISCTLATILSLWVAVPAGYLLSRYRFWGRRVVDAILDIPIVLPPLVIGLSLLILFHMVPAFLAKYFPGAVATGERVFPVTYAVPSVIIAQFTVACAFAVRTMLVTFEQISPRREQVALTLGCSRAQAFWWVALPEARRGILTAATLAWARSLGEFGPILVFSGATRMKTEVLPTSVFLELSVGNIEAAVAVSLLMIVCALTVLGIARFFGLPAGSRGGSSNILRGGAMP